MLQSGLLKRRISVALIVAIVMVAFVLRAAASTGPLWLDEIWSLQLATEASTPLDVLTDIKHDNNHFLNTLYLHLVGPGHAWFIYRIPAVLAGTLSVLIAGRIASRWGEVERYIAMAVVATSYFLVHYSSEARGYAPLMLCCLAGFELLSRYLDSPSTRRAITFTLVAICGFLSHLSFLHFYVAAVYWSVVTLAERDDTRREKIRTLAMLHVPTGVAVGLLYWINLRDVRLGGGPEASVVDVLARACSLSVGGPSTGTASVAAALMLLVAVAAGICQFRRCNDLQWKFLAFVIALPMVQVAVTQPPFLYERYFLVMLVFVSLVLSYVLGQAYRAGGVRRVACAGILVAVIGGNMAHATRLIKDGRGEYLQALQFIADSDPSHHLTITSDHNHGIGMLVRFYADYLEPRRDVAYVDVEQLANESPGWLIMHRRPSMQSNFVPHDIDVDGHSYRLARSFETPQLSGWGWHCYRLDRRSGL